MQRTFRAEVWMIFIFVYFSCFTGVLCAREEGEGALGKEAFSGSTLLEPNLGFSFLSVYHFASSDVTDADADGFLKGFRFSAETVFRELYLRGEFFGFFGSLTSTSSPRTEVDTAFIDFELAVGYPFPSDLLLRDGFLIPYVGLGTRVGMGDGSTGVDETILLTSFLLGGKLVVELSSGIRLGVDLALRSMFWGEDEFRAGGTSATVDLDPNVGIRLRVPLEFRVTSRVSFDFSFWYEFNLLEGKGDGLRLDSATHWVGAYMGIKLRL